LSQGSGVCKWFNMRMGFGFISMSSRDGAPLDQNLDVFVHQSKLHMEGFRSLREGEALEFSFKKSSKGLEAVRVSGPGGAPCLGSKRRPKSSLKRRSKADRALLRTEVDRNHKEKLHLQATSSMSGSDGPGPALHSRCYNCGEAGHHAKECQLPPQPKKCHFCQSVSHMVAGCPARAQQQ
ncbi:unnamed protein product, partial [Tetraodon nigroviridis]